MSQGKQIILGTNSLLQGTDESNAFPTSHIDEGTIDESLILTALSDRRALESVVFEIEKTRPAVAEAVRKALAEGRVFLGGDIRLEDGEDKTFATLAEMNAFLEGHQAAAIDLNGVVRMVYPKLAAALVTSGNQVYYVGSYLGQTGWVTTS